MTYARAPGSFKHVLSDLVRALGRPALAAAAGCSASRIDQFINPMRRDLPSLSQALALDGLADRAGLGSPLLSAYERQLAAAGALARPPGSPRGERAKRLILEGAVRGFVEALRRAIGALEATLSASPYQTAQKAWATARA